jgi:hypothetical protein
MSRVFEKAGKKSFFTLNHEEISERFCLLLYIIFEKKTGKKNESENSSRDSFGIQKRRPQEGWVSPKKIVRMGGRMAAFSVIVAPII